MCSCNNEMSRNTLGIYNTRCILDSLGVHIVSISSARHQILMNTILAHNISTFLTHAGGRLLLHNGCRLLLCSRYSSHYLVRITNCTWYIWVQAQVALLEHMLIHICHVTTYQGTRNVNDNWRWARIKNWSSTLSHKHKYEIYEALWGTAVWPWYQSRTTNGNA